MSCDYESPCKMWPFLVKVLSYTAVPISKKRQLLFPEDIQRQRMHFNVPSAETHKDSQLVAFLDLLSTSFTISSSVTSGGGFIYLIGGNKALFFCWLVAVVFVGHQFWNDNNWCSSSSYLPPYQQNFGFSLIKTFLPVPSSRNENEKVLYATYNRFQMYLLSAKVPLSLSEWTLIVVLLAKMQPRGGRCDDKRVPDKRSDSRISNKLPALQCKEVILDTCPLV